MASGATKIGKQGKAPGKQNKVNLKAARALPRAKRAGAYAAFCEETGRDRGILVVHKSRVCLQAFDISGAYLVTVSQAGKGRFTVTYGVQVSEGLTYAQAARELGTCIFHALSCAGKLDT